MPRVAKANKPADSTAHLGFEAKLWLAADKLRNNMDAAEYKHVVLGLIFLKYISDNAGKFRMSKCELEILGPFDIRNSSFVICLRPPRGGATCKTAPSSPPWECRSPKCELRTAAASLRHLKIGNRNSHE